MSLDQGKMMIAYDRKRTSTLTLDEQPGAHTGATRKYIPGYSDSNIVYLDTVSGNDANGGSTELLAKLTYASAVTAAGTTKKIRVINNGAALSTNITKPTEMKSGVSGTISSSLTAPVDTWSQISTSTYYSFIFVHKFRKTFACSTTKIYSSDDLVTWTEVGSAANISKFIWFASAEVLIAYTQSGPVFASSDGVSWSQVATLPVTYTIRDGIYSPSDSAVYIVCDFGTVYRSLDGSTWETVAIAPINDFRPYSIAQCGDEYAIAGSKFADTSDEESSLYTTPDFIVYTEATLPSKSTSRLRSAVYGGGIAVVGGGDTSASLTQDAFVYYSSDLTTWAKEYVTNVDNSDDIISGVYVPELSRFVLGLNSNKIYYSTNAATWSAASSISSISGINSLLYVPTLGRLIYYAGVDGVHASTAFANTISADIAGFTVQAVQYSGTVKAYNCTMKQPGTTANLSLNGCRVTEPDAHISSNTQKHTATLFEHDFHMTCTPAAQNDVQVNKCTFAESLYIYNASATAYEQVRDNIIEGGIKADYNVTVSGRDNIRGTSTNLLRGASVTSGDPKFASEADYTLQFQTNGYPRNSLAVGRSGIYFNSAGDARDIGAWSYVESAISYYYAKNSYINKGQDITVTIEETVSEQQGDNGPVSVYTNVNRIKEVLTIQYGSTDDTDRAIFDYIRTLTDKGVKIQLDPEFSSNGSTVTVNGNQSAGVEFLTVDSVATFNGMFLTISDKRYWVMRASPSASAATKLILDRPLEDAVTDNQVITTNYPSGAGEYQFSPPPQLALKRKDNSGLLTWKEGLVLRFVREWSA